MTVAKRFWNFFRDLIPELLVIAAAVIVLLNLIDRFFFRH